MTIDFSGTAGQVLTAFHTEIHKLIGGGQHFANMSDPVDSGGAAPVIGGMVSPRRFPPSRMLRESARDSRLQLERRHCLSGLTPADLATIYDLKAAFSAGLTGQGQTIAVVEDSDMYDPSDWATFRSALGLSSYSSGSLNEVNPNPPGGASNCADPGVNGDDIEVESGCGVGQRRGAQCDHPGGHLRGFRHHLRRFDRTAELSKRKQPASDRQCKLRRVRS